VCAPFHVESVARAVEGDKTYILGVSINDPSVAPHTSAAVRGFSKLVNVVSKVGDAKTLVVRMALVDPKGSIPGFLIKMKKAEDGLRLVNAKKVLSA
jgi:hypothetical protein